MNLNQQITQLRDAIINRMNVPRPQSRQMLTLLRNALAAELANLSSGSHPDMANNLRIVAGVIRRPVGGNWALIGPPSDTGHLGINIASVTADASLITINYSVTFSHVVTCIAQVDEVYRGVYEVGTSGGYSSAQIAVSRPFGLPTWGGDLDFNGSAWTFNQRNGSGSTTVNNGTTKTITLVHNGDLCGLNPVRMAHTWDGLPPFTTAGLDANQTVIRIPATYNPQAGDSIWIERLRETPNQPINPISTASGAANMANNMANIWFFALGYTA